MINHWVKLAKRKQMFQEIDEIALEVWADEGTLGELIGDLNQEQLEFLLRMKITDFVSDSSEISFGFEVVSD